MCAAQVLSLHTAVVHSNADGHVHSKADNALLGLHIRFVSPVRT